MLVSVSSVISKHSGFLPPVQCSNCKKLCCERESGDAPKHPVLLNCGHSICEGCAVSGGPRTVTCGTCGSRTHLKSVEKLDLPRNAYVVGQASLTQESQMFEPEEPVHTCFQASNYSGHLEEVTRLCDECTLKIASSICHPCNRNYCDTCWEKVHPAQNDHLPLSLNAAQLKPFGFCTVHSDKAVRFFCQPCKDYICSLCVRSNHTGGAHAVISVKEKNLEVIQTLKGLEKDVEENMDRMKETILEMGDIKDTLERNSNSDFAKGVTTKFAYLHGVLQVAEESVRQKMKRREANRKIDLDNAMTQLRRQIKTIRDVLRDIKTISESNTLLSEISLEYLLPRLTSLKNAPCKLDSSLYGSDGLFKHEQPEFDIKDNFVHDVKNFITFNEPSKIQLVNLKGENNADLGYEPKQKQQPAQKAIKVTKSVIVSGSRKKSKSKSSSSHPLPKFPYNRSHTTITQGCSYGVYLSYVKDPGEFYVMRSGLRKQRAHIEKIAPTLVDRCPRAPKRIHKDDIFLAECVLDKKWYRGRVIEVLPSGNPSEEAGVLIYNLDFGNNQVVPHSRLRKIPEVLKFDPPMAIKCRLSECTPKNGKWCEESTKMMLEILEGGELTMQVVRVLPEILEVDLCHKTKDSDMFDEESVSLRDSMIFMEYSVLTTGPRSPELKKSLTIQYPCFSLPQIGTFTGLITHVVSESSVYMQKIGIDTDYLMDLMERINSFYDMYNQKGYIYNPLIGMPCVAISTQDYLWYRAKIVNLPGHEKIKVQYVDYGSEETVHFKLVRKIKPEFIRLPPQAFLCNIRDIVNPDDSNWRANAKPYLEKMSEEIFQVTVTRTAEDSVEVVLKVDPRTLTCKTMGPPPVAKKKEARKFLRIRPSALAGLIVTTGLTPSKVDGDKISELFELFTKSINAEIQNLQANQNIPATSGEKDAKRTNDFKSEVKVLKVTSPSDIYVSVLAFAPKIEQMDKELQNFCISRAVKKNSPWLAGNNCAVLSYNHGKWLRAVVKEVHANQMIVVQYYDVVGTEEVPAMSLRVLDPHFFTYPVGSVKCHLDGLTPPESKWPDRTNERLISEMQKHDKIFMTKRGKLGDNPSLPVHLWVPIEDEAEQGEFSSRWLLLNDFIPGREVNVPKKPNDSEDDSGDSDNFVKEEYDLVDLIENDFKIDGEESNLFNGSSPDEVPPGADWIQPPISTSKYFVGEPTYVDNDGIIYMHDVDRDGPILEVMQYSLHQLFKDTQANPLEPIWLVDEICIAKYFIDNCWYRGKVVEAIDGLYNVLFVDYGNVEKCHGAWMRRCATYLQTPLIARKYKLYGVNPVSEDGKWTATAIDRMYEAIVEKKCNVTEMEAERDADDITNICLRVCDGEQDLAEYLVGLGLATFDSEMEVFSEEGSDRIGDVFHMGNTEDFPLIPQVQAGSSYRMFEIPIVDFPFPVNVTVVREVFLSANIMDNDTVYPGLRSVMANLDRLTRQMQILGEKQPLLNNIAPGVACLCLYGNHGKWYRAEIERVDTRRDVVLVHYVDFGYREYVTSDRIRTILPKWFDIPQLEMKLKLSKYKKNPAVKKKTYLAELKQCLLEPNLVAQFVARRDRYYEVVLLKRGSSVPIYQNLIDNGMLCRVSEEEREELVEESQDFALYADHPGHAVRAVSGVFELEEDPDDPDEVEEDSTGDFGELEETLAAEILDDYESFDYFD